MGVHHKSIAMGPVAIARATTLELEPSIVTSLGYENVGVAVLDGDSIACNESYR